MADNIGFGPRQSLEDLLATMNPLPSQSLPPGSADIIQTGVPGQVPKPQPQWQKILQLALPAALAAISSRQQGGSDNTAGLLGGYLAGQQQVQQEKRAQSQEQREQEAHELRKLTARRQLQMIEEEKRREIQRQALERQKEIFNLAKEFADPQVLSKMPPEQAQRVLQMFGQAADQRGLPGADLVRMLEPSIRSADTVRQEAAQRFADKLIAYSKINPDIARDPNWASTVSFFDEQAGQMTGAEIVQRVFGGRLPVEATKPVAPELTTVTEEVENEDGSVYSVTRLKPKQEGMVTGRRIKKTAPRPKEPKVVGPKVELRQVDGEWHQFQQDPITGNWTDLGPPAAKMAPVHTPGASILDKLGLK